MHDSPHPASTALRMGRTFVLEVGVPGTGRSSDFPDFPAAFPPVEGQWPFSPERFASDPRGRLGYSGGPVSDSHGVPFYAAMST
jgi:hypothetical protein